MTRLGLVAALVVLGLAEVHGQSQTLAALRAAFVGLVSDTVHARNS